MEPANGAGTRAHTPQLSAGVGRLAESSTSMRTSWGPRPGSVLCVRQRGLCGGGLCHAIRMCGSVRVGPEKKGPELCIISWVDNSMETLRPTGKTHRDPSQTWPLFPFHCQQPLTRAAGVEKVSCLDHSVVCANAGEANAKKIN